MLDYLYEWIWNLTVYMVLVTAVLQVVPGNDYKKYIRFFTGLVMIFMMAAPVLRLFGTSWNIRDFYDSEAYQIQLEKIENSTAYLADIQAEDYLMEDGADDAGKEGTTDGIKVEEIHIGNENQNSADER